MNRMVGTRDMVTNDEIREQIEFCNELSIRLSKRMINFDINDYWNNKHYQVAQDIVRLRRELLTLKKMVRVRAIDSDLPVWVAPEDLIKVQPDKCDGGGENV